MPAVATKDNWALTGQGVYFIVPGKPATVRFQDFATGKVRVICELDQVSVGMSVSPDGAYILVTHIDHLGQDLMLVENFR